MFRRLSVSSTLARWLHALDGPSLLAAEFFIVIGALSCFATVQSDTWWHLAAGREMARTHQVLLTERFSHTAFGAPWPNYEWLSQVIFYRLYDAGGMPLLVGACALSLFGACALTWLVMRGSVADRVVILTLALPLLTPSWTVRPQAFSLCLLGLTVYLVVRERLWPLPAVFLIWANLHGAVALGFLVLMADALVAIGMRRHVRRRLIVSGLCGVATLLTPLGINYWPEIVRSLQRSQLNRIAEWRPPALAAEYGVFWLLAAWFVALAAIRWRRLSSASDRMLVISSVSLLLLALRSMRNMGPFALVVAPAIAGLLRPRAQIRHGDHAEVRSTAPAARWLLVALSLVVGGAAVTHRWTRDPPSTEWTPVSDRAAAAIRGCPGPIYNHYNEGGYLIWFTPEQKVFLDSRQDPYPAELLRAQADAERTGSFGPLLDRHSVRCAVLRPDSRTVSVLRGTGWREDYRDSRWVILLAPGVEPGK